jgi:hypothetical protein
MTNEEARSWGYIDGYTNGATEERGGFVAALQTILDNDLVQSGDDYADAIQELIKRYSNTENGGQ